MIQSGNAQRGGRGIGSQVASMGAAAFGMRLLGRVVGYVFAVLVARSAGAEAWGAFSLTLACISAGAMLALTGFDTASVKVTAEAVASPTFDLRRLLSRVLSLTVLQALGVAVVLWMLGPVIATSGFDDGTLAGAIRVGALVVVPTAVVNVCVGALTGLKRVPLAAGVQYVLRLGLPTIIYLIWPEGGAILAYALGNALLAVIALLLLGMSVRAVPKAEATQTRRIRDVYALSVPLMLVSSMGLIRGWADTVLVGIYLDTAMMGIYDVAFKLASVTSLPLLAVNGIVAPLVAAATARRDWAGVERAARAGAMFSTALALVPFLVFMAVPEWVLGWFGEEFVSGAPVFRWLAVGYFLNASLGMGGYVMPMADMHRTFQYIAMFTTAVSIGLNLWLLPRFGLVGAGVASFVGILLNAGLAGGGLWYSRGVNVLPAPLVALRFLRARFLARR